MKKIFGLVAVAAIALFAVSCSGEGPGAVVEKAYGDIIKGDYKAFVEACYFADSVQGPELEQAKSMAVQMLEKTMKNAKPENQVKSVKVLKEEVNGEEATVEVEVTKGNDEVEKNTLGLKKDKDGNWKIADQGNLQSSGDLNLGDATSDALNEAGEALNEAGEKLEEVAEDAKEKAEDVAEDVADAVKDDGQD